MNIRSIGLILSCMLLSGFANSQIQIGQDIEGTSPGDGFGWRVSLSGDGNIVALVGGSNLSNGNVRVYNYVGGNWQNYGTDSQGDHFGGHAYYSIDLTDDGEALALGDLEVVKVFTYQTGIWTQKGGDILNNTLVDDFGYRVSISQDANTVALSAPSYYPSYHDLRIPPPPDMGLVQIFNYNSGMWNQVGDDFVGQSFEHSGRSISLSADANFVAISNEYSIRIFENISDVWTLKGSEIFGTSGNTKSVSLSSEGNIVAFGDPDYTEGMVQRGRVQVFEYLSGDWVQIGDDILGDQSQNYTGERVSLSSNGQVVAIGEMGNNLNGTDAGRVRVFKNIGGSWSQLGVSILGEGSEDHAGSSINLSADGSTLVIGASRNDGNGENAGHVRVYDFSSTLSTNEKASSNFRIFPNPAKDEFRIQLLDGTELQKVNIYNALGQILISTKNKSVRISSLQRGIYFVEVLTHKGNGTIKLVVK